MRDLSIWRPLNGPVEDHPIAVCDGQTVDTSKIVETDMIRGDYTGTMLYPLYTPRGTRQWYYMSWQSVEDVLLFKSFDSNEDSVKRECYFKNWIFFATTCPDKYDIKMKAKVYKANEMRCILQIPPIRHLQCQIARIVQAQGSVWRLGHWYLHT